MKIKPIYTEKKLSLADFMAGLSVAFILLPEAVAYSAIAHLPIQSAITGAIVGLISYAWLGGSAFAIVAPTSSAAALLAAVILSMSPQTQHIAVNLGMALVMLTGGGLLIFAKAGLGRLAAFVSRPVLHGFSFALALTIIIKQLPLLLGITVQAKAPFPIIAELITHRHDFSLWSSIMALVALTFLTVLKRWPNVPSTFFMLVIGMLLSHYCNLSDLNVAVVGNVILNAPALSLPHLSLDEWIQLSELALGLLIIIVAESWGSIRSLALHHGESVEPNQELSALGVANLCSGLLQGMPVGAGFSASAANEAAGAQTKLAGACAGVVLLLMTLFGKEWISTLPQALVAAAVINALSHALNPHALLKLWQLNRDQYIALTAIIAVLVFGVLHGMLMAICLSLVSAIRAFSLPLISELGEFDDTRDYVDVQNHATATIHPHILILRPEAPLFFANIESVLTQAFKRLDTRKDTQILILSLEESANLDSTATQCLIEFSNQLSSQKILLLLARVKDPIDELLSNLDKSPFKETLFWSVNDAVIAAKKVS